MLNQHSVQLQPMCYDGQLLTGLDMPMIRKVKEFRKAHRREIHREFGKVYTNILLCFMENLLTKSFLVRR